MDRFHQGEADLHRGKSKEIAVAPKVGSRVCHLIEIGSRAESWWNFARQCERGNPIRTWTNLARSADHLFGNAQDVSPDVRFPRRSRIRNGAKRQSADSGWRGAWRSNWVHCESAGLIFQNTGTKPIYLRTQTWKQEDFPTARPLLREVTLSVAGREDLPLAISAVINWRLEAGGILRNERAGSGSRIGAGEQADDYAFALVTALQKARYQREG